ncbi:MAG: hypothetical protein AAF702_26495 [Chloroflexota bacterium]
MPKPPSTQSLYELYREKLPSYVNVTWAFILDDELDSARSCLEEQPFWANGPNEGHDYMLIAVLDCLEASYDYAEENFHYALAHYMELNDVAMVRIIHLYLAYIEFTSNHSTLFLEHLAQGLREDNNESKELNYWWHPTIMEPVFTQAIIHGHYPKHAKAILELHGCFFSIEDK